MKGIEPIKILAIFAIFIFASFSLKFLVIPIAGAVVMNLLPQNESVSVYLAVTASILVCGLVVGKSINTSIHINPLTHTLILGSLAGVYKVLRPEFNPMPLALSATFAFLNFASILFGTYVTRKKA